MIHTLPDLPYAKAALEPYISAETLEFHHDKHHQAYVTNLNNLIEGSEFDDKLLEDIVKSAPPGGIFNNAAQVWNHTFYFNCLAPNAGGDATGAVADAINSTFGSFAGFKQKFSSAALANFGSGWTWLVRKSDGSLEIVNTENAGCPLTDGLTPLLTIDVWEHAYYIDKRNARAAYVEDFWHLINWNFVNDSLT